MWQPALSHCELKGFISQLKDRYLICHGINTDMLKNVSCTCDVLV